MQGNLGLTLPPAFLNKHQKQQEQTFDLPRVQVFLSNTKNENSRLLIMKISNCHQKSWPFIMIISTIYSFKFFKGCIRQVLLGPLLNIFYPYDSITLINSSKASVLFFFELTFQWPIIIFYGAKTDGQA